jgi:aminoglycoside phosphotransferase (APT) family kinase protein
LERRLERWAGGSVRRALGLLPETPLEYAAAPAGSGGRPLIVRAGGRERAVLRLLRERGSLSRLRASHRLLGRVGVPVARPLWSDASPWRRWLCGGYPWLEEHLPGKMLHLAPCPEGAHARLAGALARLHAERRACWGAPAGSRWSGWARRATGYARLRLREVAGALSRLRRIGALPAGEERMLRETSRRWRGRLLRVRDFQLIHNDLHPGNILVAEDGRIGLLDLRRVRFGRRERDLAAVAGRVLQFDSQAFDAFLERYRAAGGESPDADLLEFEILTLCLGRWAAAAERARGLRRGSREKALEEESLWAQRVRLKAERFAPRADGDLPS